MESNLTLRKADFESKVGIFLGYGAGTAGGQLAWTTAQTRVIQDCVDSGYRKFLYPAPVGPGQPYSWTFLKPLATVTLADAESTIAMPDDFGGIEGDVTCSLAGQSVFRSRIQLTGEGRLLEAFSKMPDQTGAPQLATIRPLKGTTLQRANRYEMQVFPTADQDYTFQFTYAILTDALSSANPYAYGGAYHAETLLEACLSVAEERYNNLPNGPHKNAYTERLVVSVGMDRRLRPASLGYNGDNSDGANEWYDPRGAAWVTYNGTQY